MKMSSVRSGMIVYVLSRRICPLTLASADCKEGIHRDSMWGAVLEGFDRSGCWNPDWCWLHARAMRSVLDMIESVRQCFMKSVI